MVKLLTIDKKSKISVFNNYEECSPSRISGVLLLYYCFVKVCKLLRPSRVATRTDVSIHIRTFPKIRTLKFFCEFNLISAKSPYYIEKCFKQKLSKIKFPAKNVLDAYLYFTQNWS